MHQYICKDCGYRREGLLDHPAIGIGSYSTTCPECNGQYDSYEAADVTEMIQAAFSDVKVNSAILNVESGIVDVTVTPIRPVEHITITANVSIPLEK